jgi:hypothetical protein
MQTAWAIGHYEPQIIRAETAEQDCPLEYKDFAAGGIHLSKILLSRARHVIDLKLEIAEKPEKQNENAQAIQDTLGRTRHLFCQSAAYMDGHAHISERLRVARLMVRSELLLGAGEFLSPPEQDYFVQNWEEELRDWLERLPGRSDIAAPYLLWHFIQGREAQAAPIADMIYINNAQDPVGLWFKGLFLTGKPARAQEGIAMMRKALERGIERYIPVDPQLKAQLGAAQNQ